MFLKADLLSCFYISVRKIERIANLDGLPSNCSVAKIYVVLLDFLNCFISWTKGICNVWSGDQHFSLSLPDNSYLNLTPKATPGLKYRGTPMPWHHAQRYCAVDFMIIQLSENFCAIPFSENWFFKGFIFVTVVFSLKGQYMLSSERHPLEFKCLG